MDLVECFRRKCVVVEIKFSDEMIECLGFCHARMRLIERCLAEQCPVIQLPSSELALKDYVMLR